MTQQTAGTHTPGPWKFDGSRGYHSKDVIRHNGMIVAIIPTDFYRLDRMANARLIAAAPALLAALEAVRDFKVRYMKGADVDHMLSAITGQFYALQEIATAAIALATPDKDGTP